MAFPWIAAAILGSSIFSSAKGAKESKKNRQAQEAALASSQALTKGQLKEVEALKPTEEQKEKKYQQSVENVNNAVQEAMKNWSRTMSSRGALRTGYGAGQLRNLEWAGGGEKLAAKRQVDLDAIGQLAQYLNARQGAISGQVASNQGMANLYGQQAATSSAAVSDALQAALQYYLNKQAGSVQYPSTVPTTINTPQLSTQLPGLGVDSIYERNPVPDLDLLFQ